MLCNGYSSYDECCQTPTPTRRRIFYFIDMRFWERVLIIHVNFVCKKELSQAYLEFKVLNLKIFLFYEKT